jgi:O-antigen ligase
MFSRIAFDARRSVTIMAIAVLGAAIVLALPGGDTLIMRWSGSDVATANDRLPLWTASVEAYASSSVYGLLIGNGFESSKPVVQAVASTLTSTHNAYLEVLVEFGIVGLLAFLVLHLTMLVVFWRGRSVLSVYALGAILCMMMTAMSLNMPDEFQYWVALGYLLAVRGYLVAARRGDVPARGSV